MDLFTPAPAPVDLDRVAGIYLACPHSGMYAALANRHVPVPLEDCPTRCHSGSRGATDTSC